MALACVQTAHPVGDGSFCRICGRAYVQVPDQAPDQVPDQVSVAPSPPTLPVLVPTQPVPEPTPQPAAPVAEHAPTTGATRGLVLPPAVAPLLGGVGLGAALMAVLDRLVL